MGNKFLAAARALQPQVGGAVALLLTAVLWGSSTPTVKLLLSQPHPPSAALLTAAQATLSASALLLAAWLSGHVPGPPGRGGFIPLLGDCGSLPRWQRWAEALLARLGLRGRVPLFRAAAPPAHGQGHAHGHAHGGSQLGSRRPGGLSVQVPHGAPGGLGSGGVVHLGSVAATPITYGAYGTAPTPSTATGGAMRPPPSWDGTPPSTTLLSPGPGAATPASLAAGDAPHEAAGLPLLPAHTPGLPPLPGTAHRISSSGAAAVYRVSYTGTAAAHRQSVNGGRRSSSGIHSSSLLPGGAMGTAGALGGARTSGGLAEGGGLPSVSGGATAKGGGGGEGGLGGGGGGPRRRGLVGARNPLTMPVNNIVAAGLELGLYNLVAVALGTWGVQRISATRAAFLSQATSLLTPLLVAASGTRVAALVWLACAAGAAGGALVALDGAGGLGGLGGGGGHHAVAAAGAGLGLDGAPVAATMAGSDPLGPPPPRSPELDLGAVLAGAAAGGGTPFGVQWGAPWHDLLHRPPRYQRQQQVLRLHTHRHHYHSGGGAIGFTAKARSLRHSDPAAGKLLAAAAAAAGGAGGDEASVGGGAGAAAAVLPPALSPGALGAHYVLASCVFWALSTLRMGVHTQRFRPMRLAAATAAAYACLALAWLLAEVATEGMRAPKEPLLEASVAAAGAEAAAGLDPAAGGPGGLPRPLGALAALRLLLGHAGTAAALLWTGLGPGALSSYLQALGQRTVPAAQAQMLYSSTPLWAAAMARLLLGDQGLGPTGWAGGAVMLAAALAAALMGGRRDGAAGQAAAAAPVAALAGGVVALAVTPGAGGGAPRLGRHDE